MKTVLERLRDQMKHRKTYNKEDTVIGFQDYNEKEIWYNTITGEMFTFSKKNGLLVKLGTPIQPGKVYRYDGVNKKMQIEETGITNRARIDVSVGKGDRIFVTVAQAATMLMNTQDFDRINTIEDPVVFFKDNNTWNLKGNNLCWATKELVEQQQNISRTLKELPEGQVYLKVIDTNGYLKRERYQLTYPIRPQDLENYSMVFAQLKQEEPNLFENVDSRKMYTKLFIYYMTEAKRWPDLTRLVSCGQ